MDTDTFVTALYVLADDFCKEFLGSTEHHRGRLPSLSAGEVVTLTIFSRWQRFINERQFHRFAQRHLRSAFPGLPSRTQLNRLQRSQQKTITAFALALADRLGGNAAEVQVLDCTAVVVRDRNRRGVGWLPEEADIGHSGRIGWYEGFHLLIATDPRGVITGFCMAAASVNDRVICDDFLAVRAYENQRALSVGVPCRGIYIADKGFAGKHWAPRWRAVYGAAVICQGQRERWPTFLRRWLSHSRQIVETVFEKLQNVFGLKQERPHHLNGLMTRLAARVALHNFCIWINLTSHRNPLATADLLDW